MMGKLRGIPDQLPSSLSALSKPSAPPTLVSPITDKFINVSKGTRELYLKYRIGHSSKHHVIYSAFDVDKFRNAKPLALNDLRTDIKA